MTQEALRRTPLYDTHVAGGARLVPFAGWEMPVQYSGVMNEHRAVRTAAGLFDVSHMGELRVTGPGAEAFLHHLTPNDVTKLRSRRAHYSALLTHRGTYLDDPLVYRLGEEDFLLVVNAANQASDFLWIEERAPAGVVVKDVSSRCALLALQGPAAPAILQRLTETELDRIRYYGFRRGRVAGVRAIVSRTGYTGEDGFELYVAPRDAVALWQELLEAGREDGLLPAGLGARDTLRIEAGMALYGRELDDETNAWEAGLARTVKLGAGDFIGREALLAARVGGPTKKLVGFEIRSRGIAREGSVAFGDDDEIGRVTSGTFSPTLERAIGMAYLEPSWAEPARRFEIEVRGRRLLAEVVKLPFYRRP